MPNKLNADVLAIDTLRREYKAQLDMAEGEEQHLADLRGRIERVEANIRTCHERAESYRATIERLGGEL